MEDNKEPVALPDAELFTVHLKKMEDSIFACHRAIDILEREMESNKENKIILIHVTDMLKGHIQFKKGLIIEGKKWLEDELAKQDKVEQKEEGI